MPLRPDSSLEVEDFSKQLQETVRILVPKCDITFLVSEDGSGKEHCHGNGGGTEAGHIAPTVRGQQRRMRKMEINVRSEEAYWKDYLKCSTIKMSPLKCFCCTVHPKQLTHFLLLYGNE